MNPEEAVESSSEEENLQPQRPPYLAPVPAGVKPPRQRTNFALLTPSLPKAVLKVGSMVGRVDKLKYSDHDTNDRENFPQFAPGKFLHRVIYLDNNMTMVEVRQWAAGLEQAGLLRMLNVPHFGRSPHVT